MQPKVYNIAGNNAGNMTANRQLKECNNTLYNLHKEWANNRPERHLQTGQCFSTLEHQHWTAPQSGTNGQQIVDLDQHKQEQEYAMTK